MRELARTPPAALPLALLLASLAAAGCASSGAPRPAPERPLRSDTLAENGWDRDCDLLHLTLDLTIDFEGRRVYGSATSWIRGLRADTRVVRVHAVGLEVREVEDSAGRQLAFEHENPWLTIELAAPLGVGDEEALRVVYAARPRAGMYFRERSKYGGDYAPEVWTQGQEEDNRHWFPAWDYPNDRATYDARLRVGHDMTALSNGELLKVEVHGGGERTFHWRLAQRIPTYLVAVAAGRWESYVDEWNGIPLEYHVGPGVGEERARRAFGETPRMLEYFSTLLGQPYPYAKYAQVAVSEFTSGGMENASLTLLNDRLIGDEGEVGDLDGEPRLLVAHELAHQWFGDLVTCLGWSHLWLNEAWASYLELCFEREMAGAGSFALWLERYREWYLAKPDTAVPVALDWRTRGAGDRANHVYTKGPWILHMLHAELGDEAFWRATRAYLARHADGLVTTADFGRAVFDETGANVEGFLEQWVEGGGHPVLDVRFDVREVPGVGASCGIRVRQRQKLDELVPLFDFPVVVELFGTDGSVVRRTVRVRERRELLLVPVPGPLLNVVFDADCALLCELSLAKPTKMWIHQAGLSERPALQWRALGPLRERAGREEAARVALLRVLAESPEPLLRERAASLADFDDPRARTMLVRAATVDPEARVRRAAVHALLQHSARERFEPGGQEYELFLTRRGVEPSPAVRAEIEELLDLEH